jgi:hypothetical protein
MARRDGWLEGVAVIRESDRIGHEATDQGEPWPWEIPMNIIGSRKYDFALDVTVAGAVHRVEGRFKVPKKAENFGLFSIGNKLPAGVELPVWVDPRDRGRVEIDWDRWLASPGRKEAMRAGRAATDAAYMRGQLEKNPKLRAQMHANNQLAATAWADAVQLGNLSREQFEAQLTLEVDNGRMDPADAAVARAKLES